MAQPSCQDLLDELYKKKARLLDTMSNGVQEIDQPQLGRTVFRPVTELEQQLRILDQQIANVQAACGMTPVDPNADRKVRRPIFPVVSEL